MGQDIGLLNVALVIFGFGMMIVIMRNILPLVGALVKVFVHSGRIIFGIIALYVIINVLLGGSV